jgi:hypothetical protein
VDRDVIRVGEFAHLVANARDSHGAVIANARPNVGVVGERAGDARVGKRMHASVDEWARGDIVFQTTLSTFEQARITTHLPCRSLGRPIAYSAAIIPLRLLLFQCGRRRSIAVEFPAHGQLQVREGSVRG